MRRVDSVINDLTKTVRQLVASVNGPLLDTCKVATRPTTPYAGQVIYVSDAAAGANFQGWNGTAWVNLG